MSSVTYPDGSRIEYSYDKNGNRLTQRIGGPVFVGNFEPLLNEVASGSGTYKIQLKANGPWELVASEPWLQVTPTNGTQDAEITLTFPANSSYRARVATVSFAGVSHQLRQLPGQSEPAAVVSQPMNLLIGGEGRISSVKGLPPGMRYDAKTGTITGAPTRGGDFVIQITSEVAGQGRTVLDIPLPVTPLPAWAVGAFTALIPIPDPHPSDTRMMGGDLILTSTSGGAFTGKLRLGAATHSFRGSMQSEPAELEAGAIQFQVLIPNAKDRSKDINLSLSIKDNSSSVSPGLTGQLEVDEVTTPIGPGWRHEWNARTNPAFGGVTKQMHAILNAVDPADMTDAAPAGNGFSVIQLLPAGRARLKTTLADGTRLAADVSVSPDGVFGSYNTLAANTGCAQLIATADGDQLTGDLRWLRIANSSAKDYPSGFDLATNVIGRSFIPPSADEQWFTGNTNHPGLIQLLLQGHDLASEPDFDIYAASDYVGIPLTLDSQNRLLPPVDTPFLLTTKLNTKLGMLTGGFSLTRTWSNGANGQVSATYQGLYLPPVSDSPGSFHGFYLLPEDGPSGPSPRKLSGPLTVIPDSALEK